MSKRSKNIMKKVATIALAFALVITTFTPTAAKAATKVPTLNASEVTIVTGKTFNFNVISKIKGTTYSWESRNSKVAVINKVNGVVTGISKGKTIITCTIITPDKSKFKLNADVRVIKPAVYVEIDNKITNIKIGKSYNLNRAITPASSDDEVTWTTSDETIATVQQNGVVTALKAGKVTITITSLSGRKDSAIIQVLADGEEYVEEVEETEEIVVVDKGPILSEDFSKSVGVFVGRGAAFIKQINQAGAEGTMGYLNVNGRTSNWNGAAVDVTKLVEVGKSYEVTGWVKYTDGADTETIKITQQKNGSEWPQITGDVTVEKGKWTKLTGTLLVEPGTTQCEVYFEVASSNIDFMCDNFLITDPNAGKGTVVKEEVKKEEVKKDEVKVGSVVYSSSFEDGKVCDTRASSVLTNTTAYAHTGKASVQVTRAAGWDGAGVRFTAANNIVQKNYFGKTVHVKMYVMYAEGKDEVEFKLNNKMELADGSDTIFSQKTVKKGEWTLLEADCLIADGAKGDLIFVETVGDVALTFYMDDIDITVVK